MGPGQHCARAAGRRGRHLRADSRGHRFFLRRGGGPFGRLFRLLRHQPGDRFRGRPAGHGLGSGRLRRPGGRPAGAVAWAAVPAGSAWRRCCRHAHLAGHGPGVLRLGRCLHRCLRHSGRRRPCGAHRRVRRALLGRDRRGRARQGGPAAAAPWLHGGGHRSQPGQLRADRPAGFPARRHPAGPAHRGRALSPAARSARSGSIAACPHGPWAG